MSHSTNMPESAQRGFKVRDFRNKGFFMVDDAYLNGYARYLGVHATVVYLSLCRHADKEQLSFPSQLLIAQENGMGRRTVIDKLKVLEDWNIIRTERERNEFGKWINNTYILLDKSEWRRLPSAGDAHGDPCAADDITHVQPVHTKETHIQKETHTLSKRIDFSLNGISEESMQEIADKYQVPLAFVKSKYDDLINYCERTGKRYRNYVAALRNFVKEDALKLRKEQNGRSKLTVISPDPDWSNS